VTDELPEQLELIARDIQETISSCEAEMSGTAATIQQLLDYVEQQRSTVHDDLEQRQLERLVQESLDTQDNASTTEEERALRTREVELLSHQSQVSTLQRSVRDFAHMLAASRRQFGTVGELPGIDDAQRHAVRQAMVRAKEDERRRLSREIHDGPAQVLANAIIGLEFIERALKQSDDTRDAPAVGEIQRIKSSMRDGLSEIRRFIFDLRPTMLAQRGLVGTVEHYIQTYRTLLPEHLELNLPSQPLDLTPDQELMAFRVIQESLQNIHRHADSTKCWISIETDDKSTIVKVRDNGRGFQPSSVQVHAGGGSGIIGMRERAEVIGAKLTVDSDPGSGCEVRLDIPATSARSRDPLGGGVDRHRSS
jgi:two-component system, NarL family, sensor histidine kinase DegS